MTSHDHEYLERHLELALIRLRMIAPKQPGRESSRALFEAAEHCSRALDCLERVK